MSGLKRSSLIVLTLILGACTQPPVGPEPLEFASDPQILRGVWTGASEDGHTLRLTTAASEPSADGYSVSGTFSLDGEAPVTFTGGVRVPVSQAAPALKAQASPVCPKVFSAFSGDDRWEFCGDAPEGSPPRFTVALLDQSSPGGAYIFSMAKTDAGANLLVGGQISYVQDEPYTYQEAFRFTEDSHAVVKLYYSVSALGDGDVELVAETTLEDITSFPLSYRLEGDPKTVFAREGDYFLFVDVYSDVGNTARVGDLTNEMHTPVPNPGAEVAVEVTGLESCNSPDVGGVCAGDTPD